MTTVMAERVRERIRSDRVEVTGTSEPAQKDIVKIKVRETALTAKLGNVNFLPKIDETVNRARNVRVESTG